MMRMANRKVAKVEIVRVLVEEQYPNGRVAVRVPMRRDARTGELHYTATAMRALDRLRSLIENVDRSSSPGHIASFREALGLSQVGFAAKLGVSSQTVSRWERGESAPSLGAIEAICKLQRRTGKEGVAVSVRSGQRESGTGNATRRTVRRRRRPLGKRTRKREVAR